VAQALDYAHGQGVLHRDIKPSNLLLDVQGTVWVADFGLAKAAADGDGLTNEGDVLGTLRYMAPERFRGQSDARSDLYALGLTLYELLTLRPAFDQDDRDRLIHQVTTGVPPRPRALKPEIPRDLETIVLKAIEHDPARRYQDADAMADDLGRFLADRPIRARPVGGLERTWKWAQRKPAVAGLLAALVVAVVVGFAGITWQWRQAVGARNTAKQNEARERANFQHALETVDRFCTQVSEEQLLEQPRMIPLRRRLLGLALEYYQTFQRQQGDDPKLLYALALTFERSGIIARELGDAPKSYILLLRALDLLSELRRKDPENVALRLQVARCCLEIDEVNRLNNISNLYYFDVLKLQVLVMEPLVASDPGNPEYLRLLGRTYDSIGMGRFRGGVFPYAQEWVRKAVVALERARAAAPDDIETARWLAMSLADLGLVYEQTGEYTERAATLGRARAVLAGFEGRSSRPRRDRLERGQVLVQLGLALIDVGRFGEATTRLREADDCLVPLLRENPDAVDVRYWMSLDLQGQARAALARGQRAALAGLAEAAKILEDTPAESLTARDLLALATTYVWLGEAQLQHGAFGIEERGTLRVRLADIVKVHEERSNFGSNTYAEQARRREQVEARAKLLFAIAEAGDRRDQITSVRQDARERCLLAGKRRGDIALQLDAASELIRLSELLLREGPVDEARASVNEALALLGDPNKDDPEYLCWRQGRARAWETLARVESRSDHAAEARDAAGRAVTIAEELARTDPAYSYDLACMLSLRGTVSSSESDAASAVASLRRAIGAGFDNAYLLRTDPRLDALRSRPDFPSAVGAPD
jgi:hypothetical protein